MNNKVNEIIHQDKNWQLIKNPESLKYFGSGCRGVITLSGDLHLELYSNNTIHNDILKILFNRKVFLGSFRRNWMGKIPQDSGFLTVQRYNDTNIIAIGESNKLLYEPQSYSDNIRFFDGILRRAKIKNPNNIFSNKLVGIKSIIIEQNQANIIKNAEA